MNTKHTPLTRRPSFSDAIRWMVENDDTEWVGKTPEDDGPLSVTAALVADMFGATDERVKDELRNAIAKARGEA